MRRSKHPADEDQETYADFVGDELSSADDDTAFRV